MNNGASAPVTSEVASVAADWFARLQEDDAGEQDFQEWQRWLSAAPEHGQAYREVENAWRLIGSVRPVPWASQQELAADELQLAAAPGAKLTRYKPRLFLALAAGVIAALTLAFSMYLIQQREETYATKIAEQRSVRLADGSRVTLGAQSKVTPVFSHATRRIELNFGEAYFEVAQDPARPFTVVAGMSEIRAIGTAFNVRSTDERIVVSVTEGRVGISPAGGVAAVSLSAGEQVSMTPAGTIEDKTRVASAVTWIQGRFEYRGEELRHVIEDLNRYTDRPIVLTDESLGRLRYSGTVFPDHLSEWLQGIGGALPVAVRDTGSRREISPAQ